MKDAFGDFNAQHHPWLFNDLIFGNCRLVSPPCYGYKHRSPHLWLISFPGLVTPGSWMGSGATPSLTAIRCHDNTAEKGGSSSASGSKTTIGVARHLCLLGRRPFVFSPHSHASLLRIIHVGNTRWSLGASTSPVCMSLLFIIITKLLKFWKAYPFCYVWIRKWSLPELSWKSAQCLFIVLCLKMCISTLP